MNSRPLQILLGLVLGGILVAASVDKILHPREFARIVYHYQVIGPNARIPPVVPNVFAVALPFVEALVGLLLLSGLWRREAASVLAVLLVVFIVAVSSALARGLDIENCGCFSLKGAGRAASWKLIVEDLGLLAGAVFLATRRAETKANGAPS